VESSVGCPGRVGRGRGVPALWLLASLVVLHAAALWAFRYFPSQDGPSHLENAYVLANYHDQARAYSQYYQINPRPVPNWLTHAALAGLIKVAPPLAAERVLLTGYLVLFALCLVYFINSVRAPGGEWLALVGFPLASSHLLHMGFYNFVASVPLAFLAVGYWWRRRDRPADWRLLAVLNLLLVAVYFGSVLSQAVAIGSVVGLAALEYGRRVGRTLRLALGLLPACVLPVYFVLSSSGEPSGVGGDVARWRYLAGLGVLTSFDSAERYVGAGLAAVIGFLVVAALARRAGRTREGTGFLAAALALTALYFAAPGKALGGGLIVQRLSIFPALMILPWLALRSPRPLRVAAGIAAAALAVVHLAISVHYYGRLNRGLEEFTSGVSLVGSSETLLPLTFDQKGEAEAVRVYRHAASYYCLETGAISLANYEAAKTYFPLRYLAGLDPFAVMGRIESQRGTVNPQRYPRPIDWVLLWSAPGEFPARPWIEANCRLVHRQGRLALYRRVEGAAPAGRADPKPGLGRP